MLQVPGHDARVVRPVPVAPGRARAELQPEPHGPRRRLAGNPPRRATVSQPSRSSRSLTARHHTLPGGDASSGLSTPRRACQRMNDNAARRNGRCRGARPVGPRNTCAISARRAAGSSRTAATCAPARASAPAWSLIAGSDTSRERDLARDGRCPDRTGDLLLVRDELGCCHSLPTGAGTARRREMHACQLRAAAGYRFQGASTRAGVEFLDAPPENAAWQSTRRRRAEPVRE